ncbi:sulfite reductase subunit alpha [Variovorax ginsengisoli]|uniref:NADPH--hemoprotein reductase n=1 Tax=Variovorax ginsengisoli TaxID=363844 RepID=A0ABT9S6U4_9BURK|nr:sulfite reductase subunit alpha [Variovorax ginsengisoli]MDP9899945.1 sulfite reductase (NADPH) flavoprotein alpha-component [Variovorax ginsengisoli]
MNETTWRALGAGAILLAYGLMCAGIYLRQRRRRAAVAREAATLAGDGAVAPVLVLFASQTGQAQALAWQTARGLQAQGKPVRVLSLDALDLPTLAGTAQALFIASTYGEGDAPDGAGVFAAEPMQQAASLPGLRYAVLALGDRQYTHFCAFGRALDSWLQASGATPLQPRMDVDNGDPVLLATWLASWGADGAAGQAPDEPTAWRLHARRLLNAGSAGAPVFELAFRPDHDGAALPFWTSGDLARIELTSDPSRPRDYSIASIPADGELQLIVRQERRSDGSLGAASGWLTAHLSVGDSVALRLRPHPTFRLDANTARPLILIGNGTGLAGLRSHLRARDRAGHHANWLIFGERNAAHDHLCHGEIEDWQRRGVLQRLDLAFSRDQESRCYVQHRLLQAADTLEAWLARDAALYVCGSLEGMASGVDAALRQIFGDAAVRELTLSGRYRRDVY